MASTSVKVENLGYKLVLMTEYILCLSNDGDNFTLYYPSHVSHSVFLPGFGRFWESRDQPQPGSFLSPGSKREDPGNEVDIGVLVFSKTSKQVEVFLSAEIEG